MLQLLPNVSNHVRCISLAQLCTHLPALEATRVCLLIRQLPGRDCSEGIMHVIPGVMPVGFRQSEADEAAQIKQLQIEAVYSSLKCQPELNSNEYEN